MITRLIYRRFSTNSYYKKLRLLKENNKLKVQNG